MTVVPGRRAQSFRDGEIICHRCESEADRNVFCNFHRSPTAIEEDEAILLNQTSSLFPDPDLGSNPLLTSATVAGDLALIKAPPCAR